MDLLLSALLSLDVYIWLCLLISGMLYNLFLKYTIILKHLAKSANHASLFSQHMMTSSNGNFLRTKVSDVELWCFLWSAAWIKGWVNNREAGDLRHHKAHYDMIVMHLIRGSYKHIVGVVQKSYSYSNEHWKPWHFSFWIKLCAISMTISILFFLDINYLYLLDAHFIMCDIWHFSKYTLTLATLKLLHLGPVGPRWAPCWPHEPCYQGL